MEPFGLHGIQALAAALIGKSGIVSILATVTDTVRFLPLATKKKKKTQI